MAGKETGRNVGGGGGGGGGNRCTALMMMMHGLVGGWGMLFRWKQTPRVAVLRTTFHK